VSGGVVTIATESTGNLLVLESTTDGGTTDANPELVFKSASDDAGDYIGSILFDAKNAGGTYDTYAQIFSRVDTATEAQTAGGLFFQVKHKNANTTMLWMEGHPTGTGTFTVNYNAQDVQTSIFTGNSRFNVYQDGTVKTLNSGFRLFQRGNAADMDGTGISLDFMLRETTGSSDKTAGRIGIIAEQDWTSTASTQDAAMVFYTMADGSSAERMRITSAGLVGIGTATPGKHLEVNAAASPTIRIREGSEGGYLDLIGYADSQSGIHHTNTSASENAMLDLDVTAVNGQSQNFRFFRNSNASATGFLQILEPGTSTVKMIIAADTGKTAFGTGTVDANAMVTVEGAVSLDEISAPTNTADRGQLYTNADNELHMVDGAGVDAIFLKGGKHSIWVPATAMRATTTAGCSALTAVETTAGRPDMVVLDFATGSTEFAQFNIAMPGDYAHGTAITFQVYWAGIAATTGVSWALSAVAIPNNSTIDVTFASPVQLVDDAQGAVEELNISAESGNVTVKNAAAGALTYFQFSRDHDESDDDMNGDARLLGIKIFYTVDKGNEA